MKRKYKIKSGFEEKLWKHKSCMAWFARDAGIPLVTLRAALRPEQFPGRKGFIQGRTAEKIAYGYAQVAGIPLDDARQEVIEIIEVMEIVVENV